MQHRLNSASLFPPLNLPVASPVQLKRGTRVVTRYFYADSVPGNQATVVRTWQAPTGEWFVRVNCGKNLSRQSLLKTMCLDALALAEAQDSQG